MGRARQVAVQGIVSKIRSLGQRTQFGRVGDTVGTESVYLQGHFAWSRWSQNCFVDVQSAEQGPVLCLDVVREDLDGEVAHAHLSVEVFELALHHDVECLEKQRVEVCLDFLFALVFFKLLKLLSFHA